MRFSFRALLPIWLLCSLFFEPSFAGTPQAQNLLSARKTLFTENKGQVADQHGKLRSDVKYLYAAPGLRLALKANGFSYEVVRTERFAEAKTEKEKHLPSKFQEPDSVVEHSHRVDIAFLGANAHPAILAEEAAADYKNYYLAHTPEEGVTNVRSFAKLTYKNLYPNIDVVFYAKEEGKLKYDFVLHPGARLSDIRMQYAGQHGMTAAGTALKVFISSGEVQETIPASYYEGGAPVEIGYTLSRNTVGFASLGVERVGRKMVIDPQLIWGTYFGGADEDMGYDVALDDSGYIYMTGTTMSSSGISTSGTHKTTYTYYWNGGDVFLAKFTPAGKQSWGTYYGGANIDVAYGVATDNSGNAFVTGKTKSSTGIGTSGAHRADYGWANSSVDAFLAKFTTTGKLSWGTYLGGVSGDDYSYDVAVNDSGSAYIVGQSEYDTSMATSGTHKTTNSDYDVFLAKFSSSGKRLWGTYYGGKGGEAAYGVSLDKAGNPYITGETSSDSGIATSGTHQTSKGSSHVHAFLVKFTASGKLAWGTYYGSKRTNLSNCVAIDAVGNAFIAGTTQLDSGIVTSGAHQTSFTSIGTFGSDCFIAKFDSVGKRLWGTYYGGLGECTDIALDSSGNAYIVGFTNSTTGIATSGAHQAGYGGSWDAFLTKFTSAGKRLWGTYYGSGDVEYGYGVSLDISGNAYIVGETRSRTGGIATYGAHQTRLGGTSNSYDFDAFLAKLEGPCYAPMPLAKDTTVCKGITTLKAKGALRYRWYDAPAGGTVLDTNANYSRTVLTTDTLYVAGYDGKCESKRDTIIVSLKQSPNARVGLPDTICVGKSKKIGGPTVSGNTYAWTSFPAGFTSSLPNPTVTPTVTTTYRLTETVKSTGCQKTDSVKITILPPPTISGPDSFFARSTAIHSTPKNTGSSYSWKVTGGSILSGAGTESITIKWGNAGIGTVQVKETNASGCTDSSVKTVKVLPVLATKTWTGTLSTDWHASGNWQPAGAPAANDTAYIPKAANQPIINKTGAKTHTLLLGKGTTLTVNNPANNLTLYGSLYDSGAVKVDLKTNSALRFAGSGLHSLIAPNSLTLRNLLVDSSAHLLLKDTLKIESTAEVKSGVIRTDDKLVLLSDAKATARIPKLPTDTSVQGEVTVSFTVPKANADYRMLALPVQGRSLAQWQDDVAMSGFPGTASPTGTSSVLRLDEADTAGLAGSWRKPGHLNDTITAPYGLRVYIDSLTRTLDAKGPIYQGEASLSVSYTSTGNSADDGWNLVGNPYPSAIDWNASGWTKSNVESAIYVWNPKAGQYAVWNGTAGTNGGSRYVALGQGFLVKANGTSPILKVTEDVKTDSPAIFLKAGPASTLQIALSDKSGNKDESVLQVSGNATLRYESDKDAYKLPGKHLNLGTRLNNLSYSINAIPEPVNNTIVPLLAQGKDSLALSFSNLSSFGTGISLYLKDMKKGDSTLITEGMTRRFLADASVPYPYAVGVHNVITALQSADRPSEEVRIYPTLTRDGLVNVEFSGTQPCLVRVLDMTGREVFAASLKTGTTQVQLPQTQGVYLVRVQGQFGLKTAKVVRQ